MFGIAVTTSSICVSSRCAWLRAGVGAISTQNVTNPALGKEGLDLLEEGLEPQAVLDRLVEGEPFRDWRQLAVVGRTGGGAAYSGAKTLGTHAEAKGANCVAAGNLLANPDVPQAMANSFAANPTSISPSAC